MMTQSQAIVIDEQYIAQQSNSTAPEVQTTIQAFLSNSDPNAPGLSETNPQTIPCREPLTCLSVHPEP
jgi:hypothetical protein